jgi:hypothetical protein
MITMLCCLNLVLIYSHAVAVASGTEAAAALGSASASFIVD